MEQVLDPVSSVNRGVVKHTQTIKTVREDISDILDYDLEEYLDTDEHPSRFLGIYDGDFLLGYLQFGYFAPNGHKPFYYIANLNNLSDKKGIGKRLMRAFVSRHKRVFLDDNATIQGKDAKGYYAQFGFSRLPDSNIWQIGFHEKESKTIPLLYTRIIASEFQG